MIFREFNETDAVFCYKIRSAAFIQKFYDEIGSIAVSAGVNSYMPEDYIRLFNKTKIFIVEDNYEKIGFVSLKKIVDNTVEIPLIYFLNHLIQQLL